MSNLTLAGYHRFLYTMAWIFVFRPPFVGPIALFRFSTIRALMNLATSRINTEIFSICSLIQFRRNLHTIIPPFSKTSIDTLPSTISFWKLSPLCPTMIDPEHPVQHHPVIFPGASFLPHVFRWEQWLKSFPLFICNVIVIHTFIIAFAWFLCNFNFSNKA